MKQDELALYKRALRDYKLSRFLPKRWFNTQYGFCCYFNTTFPIRSRLEGLPSILFRLRPEKRYKKNTSYWFPEGALKPRIKLLEEAIKICKTKKR